MQAGTVIQLIFDLCEASHHGIDPDSEVPLEDPTLACLPEEPHQSVVASAEQDRLKVKPALSA
jgi:hypothetical protein